MQKADYLLRLMKQRTDALVATDEKLQQFLMWVNEKSLSVSVPYKPAAVRAFYFAVAVARDMAGTRNRALSGSHDLACALNLNIDHTPNFDIIVDLKLGRIFARAHALTPTLDDASVSNIYFDISRPFAYILNLKLDLEFEQAMQQLKAQLPDSNTNAKIFKQWLQANGQAWIEQLRAVMIQHRNIGHDWQFSDKQIQVLKQYYNANKLLVDCLNSDCNVAPEVRSHIEDTLLLPIAEIEKHKQLSE
jgi:predicted NACHT family NTPase